MNAKRGFTLTEFFILLTILVFMVAIVMPSFLKARNKSLQNACINNLRIIHNTKEAFAMTARLTDGDIVVTASVNMYIKDQTTPICPAGGTYTYGNIGSMPQCSITTPTSHILGGRM